MKRDVAERFAATAVPGVDTGTVQVILSEFLAWLARCPACEGTGRVTFARAAELDVGEVGRRAELHHHFIPAGTEVPCPLCGIGNGEALNADPQWVAWRCYGALTEKDCKTLRQADHTSIRDEHAECGYRIMLPIEQDE